MRAVTRTPSAGAEPQPADPRSRHCAWFFLGTALLATGAWAHDGEQHQALAAAGQAAATSTADVTLYDESLLDQHGDRVRFVSDVIADRVVVMDFVYTTCTTVCPVLSAIFQKVQVRLGDRLGEDVVMVSISVDPGTDTPARLRDYATKLRASPEWVFLTGGEHVVDKVLEGLGAYSQDFTQHPNMTLVGDGRQGSWTRMYGFTNPDQIVAEVERLIAARDSTMAAAAAPE